MTLFLCPFGKILYYGLGMPSVDVSVIEEYGLNTYLKLFQLTGELIKELAYANVHKFATQVSINLSFGLWMLSDEIFHHAPCSDASCSHNI